MAMSKCATHHINAFDSNDSIVMKNPNIHPDSSIISTLIKELGFVINQHYITTSELDKMYAGSEYNAISQAMANYRNGDRGLVLSRAKFKLNLLTETLGMAPMQLRNSTIIDFGAAPGHFMRSYLDVNENYNNLIIPVSIQSTMNFNLSADAQIYQQYIYEQSQHQENFIKKTQIKPNSTDGLPRIGLLAPELYPLVFPQYDGNIFCAKCRNLIIDYVRLYLRELPPLRLLLSDIGGPIQYERYTHRPTNEMDYFYLPHLLLDMADTLEDIAASYYNHRIMIICKMQRFGYQMCHDPNAYIKMANLLDRCDRTNRYLLIVKPYGSRNSNNEMYALIIPHSEIDKTTWYESSLSIPSAVLRPNNMANLKHWILQMDTTMRQIINTARHYQNRTSKKHIFNAMPKANTMAAGYNIKGGSTSITSESPLKPITTINKLAVEYL